MKVNGRWVPYVRNSFSFIQILLKLYRCLDHALKLCMWFEFELCLFCQAFTLRKSSYSFIPILFPILLKLYIFLDHALKIRKYF